jgi:Tol biopolymer transport system component
MEEEKSEYLDHIWVVSADGASNIQYTRGDASATSPAFSPDGRYMAFLSKRSEKTAIWMMRVRGGEAEQVSDGEGNVASFKWSPDGARIGFTMADPETEEEKKKEKEKRDVILVDKNFHYNHLYTITVDKDDEGSRKTQRVTEGKYHVTSFDWSPDGKTIVFAFSPDPRLNQNFINRDISTVSADGGETTSRWRYAQNAGRDAGPLRRSHSLVKRQQNDLPWRDRGNVHACDCPSSGWFAGAASEHRRGRHQDRIFELRSRSVGLHL